VFPDLFIFPLKRLHKLHHTVPFYCFMPRGKNAIEAYSHFTACPKPSNSLFGGLDVKAFLLKKLHENGHDTRRKIQLFP